MNDLRRPEYKINKYECPNCADGFEADNVALVNPNESVVWCSCGTIFHVKRDNITQLAIL